jgi:hypothetical protein
MSVGHANLNLSKGNKMTTFTNETQKDRRAYSDYWGIEIADVYYCEECGCWTHLDEDELPICKCA